MCKYNIRDFDIESSEFNPIRALGTFKNIINALDRAKKDTSGCRPRDDMTELVNTIRRVEDNLRILCENAHQVQQQQQQQQGGKRKNNSKNNTKKRKPSRKNNRKRRASKNKRN